MTYVDVCNYVNDMVILQFSLSTMSVLAHGLKEGKNGTWHGGWGTEAS